MFGTHDRTGRAAKQKRQMLVVFVCNALILLMNRRPNRADGEFIKSSEDPCSAHHKKPPFRGLFWCLARMIEPRGRLSKNDKCFVARKSALTLFQIRSRYRKISKQHKRI